MEMVLPGSAHVVERAVPDVRLAARGVGLPVRAVTELILVPIGALALAFAGGFWLLQQSGVLQPSTTVAVVGIAIFVVVAFPAAMIVGGATDRKVNPDQ